MKQKKFTILLIAVHFYLGIALNAHAQSTNYIFRRITSDNGLSNSHVRYVTQDRDGFMWFGTENGLNRYDGYDIKVYKNSSQDSSSLRYNDIFSMFVDSDNNLWVGTHKGLDRYKREFDQFEHINEVGSARVRTIIEDKEKTIWIGCGSRIFYRKKGSKKFLACNHQQLSDEVRLLFEDRDGTFWVASTNNFYTLDHKTDSLKIVPNVNVSPIQSIVEDDRGSLWLGSFRFGITQLDKKTKVPKKYLYDEKVDAYSALALYYASNGKIWAAVENQGIIIIDPAEHTYQQFKSIEGDAKSLSFNTVFSFCEDLNGNVWVGTFMGGVNYITQRKFKHISTAGAEGKRLSNNYILSLCEDREKNIWIGTDGGGLNKYNRESGTIEYFMHDPKNPKSITNNFVTSIAEDHEGNIWTGFWAGGIAMYDKKKNEFIKYRHDEKNPENSLIYDRIIQLYVDKNSNLWVCSVLGLELFDKNTKKFIHHHYGNATNNHIRNVYEVPGEDGILWVSTRGGLLRYDKNKGTIKEFTHNDSSKTSVSNDKVMSVYVDKKKRMWVCSAGGLDLFDKTSGTFFLYNQNKGFPSETIYGILEDNEDNLWLSTANGLSRFNPGTLAIKNFSINDGLQGNQFKERAFLKLHDGEMMFGGNSGISLFRPEDVKDNTYIPPVVVTAFRIFNEPVLTNSKDSPLQKDISVTKELTLSYKQSVFSFDFAALNYLLPEKNQYAYIMEGFEENWNYVGNKRSATYTNLNPGEYTFRVKASNNDGLWNEQGTAIKIIIVPPFWKTKLFISLSIATILFLTFTWYKARVRSIEKQNELLELQVQERTQDLHSANHKLVNQQIQLKEQAKDLSLQAENLKEALDHMVSANKKIEELYGELKDNIRAAETIQQSILPPTKLIKEHFSESFILYKPKDVVSGDFYWYNHVNDHFILAVCDCTGHGVSGALMSINGHHLLNQCILPGKQQQAADILTKINKSFHEKLEQIDVNPLLTGGMTVGLCVIDKEKNRLQFSGANSPLYILRGSDIIKIDPSPLAIGMKAKHKESDFINHEVPLLKGDILYLFTDGYADQFGGEDRMQKFMYPRFRKLLVSIGNEKMERQKELLSEALKAWQKDIEQVDDILIVGIKI